MIPNNAFIYSVMHSRNPLPLDWMQHHEYIGAEEQFTEMVTQDLQENIVYLFVDKIDSKLFYKGIIPFDPDFEFNHSYIPWLTSQCENYRLKVIILKFIKVEIRTSDIDSFCSSCVLQN